jgi:UDP-N-acetyl-D-mannosaminuronic acid dehydrogenase
MKEADVVILGLGYIGLPTAALMAKNKIKVHGVDINPKVVDTINKGEIHIVEPSLDHEVSNAINQGLLRASVKPIIAETYVIVVPTPFRGNYIPDISYVLDATSSILPLLKKDDLLIIESTSPVGTTEKIQEYIITNRPELKGQLYVAYCPERVLPGNVMFELVNNDRVIGGINAESTSKAIEFYRQFVKGNLHPTNSRTAEMCKLTENASRDVQIAFSNELSIICDKAEINVWELIALANKHPRVNILKPGCGVGGHCIAVDPYFLVADFPNEARIIKKAREINNYKTLWCIEKILTAVYRYEVLHARRPRLGVLGLAFKPDIDDLRESPAVEIVSELFKQLKDDEIYVVEPNIIQHSSIPIVTLPEALKNADILIYLVSHKEFKNLNLRPETQALNFCEV